MPSSSQANRLFNTGILAAFATLAFVGTTIIRIPIPASGGYFNLGDTFVMAAALLYGPWIGGLVGLIGWTPRGAAASRVAVALAAGILILVAGYYVFEALIYPVMARRIPFFGVTDPTAALAEILPNLFQGVFSAAIAFGIWRVLGKKQTD